MTPKRKYLDQKWNAIKRGIPFLISFDEWWSIWQQSGHWDQRGYRQGQYCMSRYNDIGPYSYNNVFIQPIVQNTKDAQIGRKQKHGICPHCGFEGPVNIIGRDHKHINAPRPT